MSLNEKAINSALWQVLGGGWLSLLRLGASFILARALTPADYGVFGVAILIRFFIERLGSVGGFSNGLIALKKVRDIDISTCFWSMALVRIFLFFVTFLIAPAGGWFFNDLRVVNVVRVISVTFLFSILGGVATTLLSKQLQFKVLNIVSGVCGLLEISLTVFLALNTDLGYWVLVIGTLFNSFLTQTTFFIIIKWRPKFKFSGESFTYLYRYAINGLGYNITDYLKQNLDYLLVGRFLGTASLGLYEFAYRLPHMILDQISKPVADVVLPVLSKVNGDNEKISQGYIQTIKYVCFLSFPLLFGLIAVADVAVPLLWGEQWVSMITPLRILCISAALKLLSQPLSALYICKDRPDIPFKISFFELIWTALIVSVLSHSYGVIGVSVGMVLSVCPVYYFLNHAFKMLDSKLYYLILETWPSFFCSSLCCITAYSISQMLKNYDFLYFYILLISVLMGAIVYFASFYLFYKGELIVVFDRLLKIIYKKNKEVKK